MKMSTLRDQSAPVLYGLVVLFVLSMGGFSIIFSSTNPSTGNNENCDPERFIACSDNGEISITIEDYYRRYYNSIDFFHSRANPFGPNSPYSATDQQLDTINALNQVWPVMINEKIMNKFISNLDLLSNNNANEEIIKFMPNCKINIKKSNDPRSYRLSNQKILNAGFKFKVDIERGIKDFIKKYQEGKIKSNENAYSINFINKIKKK